MTTAFDPTNFQVDDCRVCTDINDWAKKAKKEAFKDVKQKNQEAYVKKQQAEKECPPDALELGRATWTFLHTMSVYYPERPTVFEKKHMSEFINTLSKIYPCGYCAAHMQETLKINPPAVHSKNDLAQWFCELHNEVNERLGKPKFDCSKVFERWKDGPADGSCN